MFKKNFKKFDFHGFTYFVFELIDKYKLNQIRFDPEHKEIFSEVQLSHIAPGRDLNNSNGFVWAWVRKKDIVKKVSFRQFSKDQSKEMNMKIDLDKGVISLEKVRGLSSVQIEEALNNNLGTSLIDKSSETMQTQKEKEMLKLEPEFYGERVNLKTLWHKIKSFDKKDNRGEKTNIPNQEKNLENYSLLKDKKFMIATIVAVIGIVVAVYFGIQNQDNQNVNTTEEQGFALKESIYNLIKKIDSEKTTLDKQELLKKYIGLKVADRGYIMDLFKTELLLRDVYHARVAKFNYENTTSSEFILPSEISFTCRFDKEWGQRLKILDIPSEISFEGVISGDYSIRLDNCRLK